MGVQSIGKSAFAAVYEKNFDTVYKIALKYSGNHHTAEELTQSVFLKLYMNMDHVKMEAVEPWLFLTVKYMALNYNRDNKWEDPAENPEAQRRDCQGESPEEVFIRKIKEKELGRFADDIFAALYQKNQRWYDAITITYILERPQKEVAESMGVTLEVLHSMLYRAKNWIRRNYREEYNHLSNA